MHLILIYLLKCCANPDMGGDYRFSSKIVLPTVSTVAMIYKKYCNQ